MLKSLDASLKPLPVTAADRKAQCARYGVARPSFKMPPGKPRLLPFQKINGFRDGPSGDAADQALHDMARQYGWALVETDN